MSYNTQARMSRDSFLQQRIAACAATQGIEDSLSWASQHQWLLAASPGWDEAYSYAIDTNREQPSFEPGIDSAVINDAMILSAVQALILKEQTPGTTEGTEPTTI